MNRHVLKISQNKWLLRLIRYFFVNTLVLKIRRFFMAFLPFFKMQSQVKNISYFSFLVDIDKVKDRYPSGVTLWEKNGKTIFTILVYQHQHFGFSFLGKFRKLFPSPKQSNWRFYIDEKQQQKTVIFEQTMVDQLLYVVAGRLFSDGMPAQYAKPFIHKKTDHYIDTIIHVDQQYQFESSIELSSNYELPTQWQELFSSWDNAVVFLSDQDHAWVEFVDQPNRISQADIRMPFNYKQIQAAQVLSFHCPLLEEWGISFDQIFCFVVPDLEFYVINETELKIKKS